MRFIKFSILCIALSLFTSCVGFYNGNLVGSATLTQANFKYVQLNAQGQASDDYFLGLLGGLKHKTMVAEAKIDLMRNYPLEANQALVNVSVNFKRTIYLGLIHTMICTVTADIVEFTK